MKKLLLLLNRLKIKYGDVIPLRLQELYRKRYKEIIEFGFESKGGWIIKRSPLQNKEKKA
jgi:hypothetical protein